MKYKYTFFERYKEPLIKWLDQNKIDYYLDGGKVTPVFVNFTLCSDSDQINDYLSELHSLCLIGPIITAEYTPAEISSAKFLMVGTRKQCIDIINTHDAYRYSCVWANPKGELLAWHAEQHGLFAIAKEPTNKKRTAFWHEDTGIAEMFTDQRVFDLVNQHKLVGVRFNNVILPTGKISQRIYQMTSDNIITQSCIAFGYGEKRRKCPRCGKEQFFVGGEYQLHVDFSLVKEESDLYITERIFGESRPYPLYIISQRFYQLLKKANLMGSLVISPVANVSF